jgi:ubiquinone/menaquinone biosynthesis C-methylase UbiE
MPEPTLDRERFSPVADIYDRFRPSYPDALADAVLGACGAAAPARVLDVACGTGIAARLFAGRGLEVAGVDVNAAMLARAARRARDPAPDGTLAPPVRYVCADATRLPFADARFALAVVAQALHWLDLSALLPELRRVLAPGGAAAAFWNVRGRTPFLVQYHELLRARIPGYPGPGRAERTIEALLARDGVAPLLSSSIPNPTPFTREAWRGYVRSNSYVAHGPQDPAELDRALDALFDAHAREGRLVVDFETRVVVWRMRG